jgi:hypothetical protein
MRLAPLLAVGALVLHKIDALARDGAMGGHGHSYVPLAAALITVLLALACTGYARELWQASRGRVPAASPPSLRVLWVIASAALLITFGLQEWIEGWVTPGHPGTISHALSHIGWLGPVLAVALGGVIAAILRASQRAIVLLARRHAARRRTRVQRGRWAPIPPPVIPRLSVLAGNLAGRAPPAHSFS